MEISFFVGYNQNTQSTSEYCRKKRPPKPNNFNFKPSTLIHLITKETKKNVTEALIAGLELGPRNLTTYYGHCQGAGIHIISTKNWTLPFKLVYVDDSKPCYFQILRLTAGKLRLSIPNFVVRFLPIILYRMYYKGLISAGGGIRLFKDQFRTKSE